jgi:hypothetical protein
MKTQATLHCYGFGDHERTIIKSLLQTFGELPNTQWRYSDHESADVVLIDCDNPQAVQDAADGTLNARFLVACSSRQYRCPGARDLLRKPLRPRELVTLLTSLDNAPDSRAGHDAYPLLS